MASHATVPPADTVPIGIGCYTVPEAARLLRESPLNIRRWLGGYRHGDLGTRRTSPPLWTPQLPKAGVHLELGFRDLIELRFVTAFLKAGLALSTVRLCLDHARVVVGSDRPFSTGRFHTDGRRIFLDSLRDGDPALLDLKQDQYVFRSVVERTFKDLDIADDVVTRWRPYGGKPSVVVDPRRSFGQPVTHEFGVPTVVLAEAVDVEGSVERAAFLYDVSVSAVRDAVGFERQLRAA